MCKHCGNLQMTIGFKALCTKSSNFVGFSWKQNCISTQNGTWHVFSRLCVVYNANVKTTYLSVKWLYNTYALINSFINLLVTVKICNTKYPDYYHYMPFAQHDDTMYFVLRQSFLVTAVLTSLLL